jgi:hypothetical protein
MDMCPECNDTGYVVKLDVMHAKKFKQVCPVCHGIKHKEFSPDGIRMAHTPADPVVWQTFIDNKPVASLGIMVRPVIENGRVKTVRKGSDPLARPTPVVFATIYRMFTRPDFRMQGHMKQLFSCAIQDWRIQWVEANEEDWALECVEFFLHMGFNREGERLIIDLSQTPEIPMPSIN